MKRQSTIEVLALDLSLLATGQAWFLQGNDVQVQTIKPTAKSGMDRLDEIMCQATDNAAVGNSTLVVFEELAFAAHDRGHERAGLAFLTRHRLWELEVPYVLVAPTTLKKFVTGSGKAEKSMMIMEVYKRFGIEPKNDNEADAIGLLYIGRALTGSYVPSTQAQRECLQTIVKANSEALRRVPGCVTAWK